MLNGCDALGSLCDAGGANDGVCAALPFPATSLRCIQGGTATEGCDPNGTRVEPSSLCTAPLRCDAVADGGVCQGVCSAALTCAAPEVCLPLGTGAGSACVACVDVQSFCSDTTQCCNGTCDPDVSACL